VGCEARKIPAAGEVFFLDFAFYGTYQELAHTQQDVVATATNASLPF
jgi:hypothetical protein